LEAGEEENGKAEQTVSKEKQKEKREAGGKDEEGEASFSPEWG
jgi:hypothetical protein